MSANVLETKIERLREELEQLLAKQKQRLMQPDSSTDRRKRELEQKRAEILERRIHKLGEMLATLGIQDRQPSGKDSESVGQHTAMP